MIKTRYAPWQARGLGDDPDARAAAARQLTPRYGSSPPRDGNSDSRPLGRSLGNSDGTLLGNRLGRFVGMLRDVLGEGLALALLPAGCFLSGESSPEAISTTTPTATATATTASRTKSGLRRLPGPPGPPRSPNGLSGCVGGEPP